MSKLSGYRKWMNGWMGQRFKYCCPFRKGGSSRWKYYSSFPSFYHGCYSDASRSFHSVKSLPKTKKTIWPKPVSSMQNLTFIHYGHRALWYLSLMTTGTTGDQHKRAGANLSLNCPLSRQSDCWGVIVSHTSINTKL